MSNQLILDLDLFAKNNFTNYYIGGNNVQAVTSLQSMAGGRGQHYVYLWGASGCGCTHLLQASCREANRIGLRSLYLSLANVRQLSVGVLDNLESLNLVCVDDLDYIAGDAVWEEALFGLFNRMAEAGKRLMVAAHNTPTNAAIVLPDLVSRLNAGLMFHLDLLADEEKEQALLLRAKNYGLIIPPKVIQFLINHYQRDTKSLFVALDQLDRAALREQRKISIPLIKEVLAIL